MPTRQQESFLYTRFLVGLIVLLLIGALLYQEVSKSVIYALMGAVMVLAVWHNSRSRWLTGIMAAIGLANVGASLWVGLQDNPSALAIGTARSLGVIFVGTVGTFLLREIWRERNVTLDTIFGAIAVYLLIGIGWTHIYSLIETIEPGSFATRVGTSEQWHDWQAETGVYPRLLFFSFVTLTTLGYGDILPLTAASKGFSIAEAVAGPVYLAILMARLVGLYVAQEARQNPEPRRGRKRD